MGVFIILEDMTRINLISSSLSSKQITKPLLVLLLVSFINSFSIAPAFAAKGIIASTNQNLQSDRPRLVIKSPNSSISRAERLVNAQPEISPDAPALAKNFALLSTAPAKENPSIAHKNGFLLANGPVPANGRAVTMTAYNSEKSQTDDDPCTTANGFNVCIHNTEDTVAANFLPMGTVIKAPELFGEREFVVRDRTHPKYGDRVDFWFKSRQDALQFGKRHAKIVVVSTPDKVRIATVN